MKKIFVGIPDYTDMIPILTSNMISDIQSKSFYRNKVSINFKTGMPVHKARNMLVEEFLRDPENAFLIMIDSDNPISVEGFDRLVDDVYGTNKHIVCGTITSRKRTGIGRYCIAVVDEKVDKFGITRPHERYKIPANKRLVKADNCGTGCVIYSREVIEKAYMKYLTIYEFMTERYILNDMVYEGKVVDRQAVPVIELEKELYYPVSTVDGIQLLPIDTTKVPPQNYICQPFGEDLYAHSRMKSLGYQIRCDTTVIGKHIISRNEYTTIKYDMYSGLVLSIVIPVYNNTKFIRQIVEDIKKKVRVEHEVIVINDGSSKESGVEEELKKLKEEYKIKYFNQRENQGVNNARMLGINKAKGRFVWVINDDILIEEGLAEGLIDRLDDDNLVICPQSTTGKKLFQGGKLVKQNNICGRCWMVNKDNFVNHIGNIPKNLKLWFGDDWIFHRVVEDLKKNVVIMNGKICHHFESQTVGKKFTGRIGKIIDKDRQEWIKILQEKGWTDYRLNIVKGVLIDKPKDD